jgi:carbamoyl-phosphate synthase large subunit
MNILLLSAGGPACHGVIKSLRDIDFNGKIVSVDCNPLSAGFYLSDKFYVVPRASDKNYINKLVDIINKEDINLILPTSSREIITISKNKKIFDELGVTLFMSDYESIIDCSDKMKFYNKCKNDFILPETSLDNRTLSIPFFAKPKKHSSGSRGVRVCKTISDISCLDRQKYEYIYQEYLPGMEYTIDVLCDMESNPIIAVPRKRLQTKEGISSKGQIVIDESIQEQCFDICKFLKLKGPVCIQMKESVDNVLKFVEINPRFGGGSYMATLAGVNFMELILNTINGDGYWMPKPKEITVLRYYNEVVV